MLPRAQLVNFCYGQRQNIKVENSNLQEEIGEVASAVMFQGF